MPYMTLNTVEDGTRGKYFDPKPEGFVFGVTIAGDRVLLLSLPKGEGIAVFEHVVSRSFYGRVLRDKPDYVMKPDENFWIVTDGGVEISAS